MYSLIDWCQCIVVLFYSALLVQIFFSVMPNRATMFVLMSDAKQDIPLGRSGGMSAAYFLVSCHSKL
jgi:hypothetical protein